MVCVGGLGGQRGMGLLIQVCLFRGILKEMESE